MADILDFGVDIGARRDEHLRDGEAVFVAEARGPMERRRDPVAVRPPRVLARTRSFGLAPYASNRSTSSVVAPPMCWAYWTLVAR